MMANTKNREIILQATRALVERLKPEKIILYGSYATGKATADSDVDLFIIKKDTLPRIERSVVAGRIVKNWETKMPFDLTIYTPEETIEGIEKGDAFLKDVLQSGELLYG